MTRREASRRWGVEGGGERRQQYEDEAPGGALNASPPHASSPDQWPTVERRVPPLLACAGIETPRLFGDDILTVCALCSAAIYHRPGALAEMGPLARAACLPCAARHEEHTRPGDGPRTAGMTAGTLREATRYLSEHRR